jgi:uncharacterized protein YutE (UPF0331/DUF86 family)
VKSNIDIKFIELKSIFIVNRLEYLKKYVDLTIEVVSTDFERIKSVEKVIQEIVDFATDINQYLVENILDTEVRSSKDSFWKIQTLIKRDEQCIKKLIDTVSFRNEIIHSYDSGIRNIWKKRNIGYFIDIYCEYVKDVQEFIAGLGI